MAQASEFMVEQDEKKKMVVRVDPDIHKMLGELVENIGETYGDVVARVTKHYSTCPEVRRNKQKE